MAIYCEYINLIIPITKIDSFYLGGFSKFKEDNAIGFAIGVLGDLRNTISGAKETIYKLSGKNVDNLNLTEKNLAYSLKSFNDTLGTIETEDVLFNTAKGIGSAVAQLYSIGKAFTAFKAMGLE
jgi:hypothetical protein